MTHLCKVDVTLPGGSRPRGEPSFFSRWALAFDTQLQAEHFFSCRWQKVNDEMCLLVSPLTTDRTEDAIAALVKALLDYPLLTFLFPNHDTRVKASTILFRYLLSSSVDDGLADILLLDDQVIGAAVWSGPEDRPRTFGDRARWIIAQLKIAFLLRRPISDVLRGVRMLSLVRPTLPHWYLLFIGIASDHQGRRLGTLLLSQKVQRADETQMWCYLETASARAQAFYCRLGYRIALEISPFKDGPIMWTMIRQPL